MMIILGWLIREVLDLDESRDEKGGDHDERHNVREGSFMDARVHQDERDHQQNWDAQHDRREKVDWIGGLRLVSPLCPAGRDISCPDCDAIRASPHLIGGSPQAWGPLSNDGGS